MTDINLSEDQNMTKIDQKLKSQCNSIIKCIDELLKMHRTYLETVRKTLPDFGNVFANKFVANW